MTPTRAPGSDIIGRITIAAASKRESQFSNSRQNEESVTAVFMKTTLARQGGQRLYARKGRPIAGLFVCGFGRKRSRRNVDRRLSKFVDSVIRLLRRIGPPRPLERLSRVRVLYHGSRRFRFFDPLSSEKGPPSPSPLSSGFSPRFIRPADQGTRAAR